MMKVLWLTNIPSPYRVDFFNMLGEKCELTVLFEKDKASDRNSDWINDIIRNFNGIILNGIRTGSDKAFCPSIITYLNRRSYDAIIISNYSTPTGMLAIQWLKLKRIPFGLEVDGGFIKKGSGIKEKLKRHLIGAASCWFSSGAKTTEYLVHYGARKEKIFRYPFTSIRESQILENIPSHAEKTCLRRKLGIEGKHVAVAVGQFIQRKGFDTLIHAWANAGPDQELMIIGGGELTEEYKELINRYSLNNVKLIGFKKNEELFEYYKAADLFVLPTKEDIWGLVVNEAMACGLPVVTTDMCIGGLELVENQVNGYIVPAGNIEMLSEKMNALLSNDKVLDDMSNRSLEKIREYTMEKMVDRHLEYLMYLY